MTIIGVELTTHDILLIFEALIYYLAIKRQSGENVAYIKSTIAEIHKVIERAIDDFGEKDDDTE